MTRQSPRLAGVLLLALLPAGLHAQQSAEKWLRECERGRWNDDQERACEVRELSLARAGNLLIEPDRNGGVAVYGWDRDSIAISARIRAGAPTTDEARDLAREVKLTTGAGRVSVDGPGTERRRQWNVMLVVMVPRRTGIEASTVNGPLSVDGVTGTMRLEARNGPVSLTAVGGDVRASVENGPLSVELAGSGWEGRGLDASSRNGPVTLAVPRDYNAELETGTINGPSSYEMPITVTLQGRRPERIRATLGKGGAQVRVVGTNGPFTLRAAR